MSSFRLYASVSDKEISGQRKTARCLLEYSLYDFFGTTLDQHQIQKTPSGKPFVAGRHDINYNISHTAGYVVCAVGTLAVGVDIEQIRPISQRVINRFLDGCPAEQAVLKWTMRESYGKMTGEGFFHSPTVVPHTFLSYYEISGYIVTLCAERTKTSDLRTSGFIMANAEFPKKITWYKKDEGC